jgi:hypothetical protein
VIVAFVASALPVRFIRAHALSHNISRIVCASKELEEVFRYALPSGANVDIKSIPTSSGTLTSLWLLMRELRCVEEIIIFHECCWVTLDVAILITKPKLKFFPQVSLLGFSRLRVGRIPNLIWLYRSFGAPQALLLLLWRQHFDFFDTTADGGFGREVIAALRLTAGPNVTIACREGARDFAPAVFSSSESMATVAMLVCAREPVQDVLQTDLYQLICDRLSSAGYEIHIKDHPRGSARLNFDYPGAVLAAAHIPADLYPVVPSLVIGVCSSALASYGARAISLIRLLPMAEPQKNERIAHLLALSGGCSVHMPSEIHELWSLISPECYEVSGGPNLTG